MGIGIALQQNINAGRLSKVVVCWIGTPIGAMLISFFLYKLFQYILNKTKINLLLLNSLTTWGLLLSGAYGAYALGANNVANVTGVFAEAGLITVRWATIIGGISIAVGAVTYSKRVMLTVGGGIFLLYNGVEVPNQFWYLGAAALVGVVGIDVLASWAKNRQ